jgi:hypothetical protein
VRRQSPWRRRGEHRTCDVPRACGPGSSLIEVILPLDAAVAQTHANVRGTFYLMITMTVFGLFGLMLVVGEVRRSTVIPADEVIR